MQEYISQSDHSQGIFIQPGSEGKVSKWENHSNSMVSANIGEATGDLIKVKSGPGRELESDFTWRDREYIRKKLGFKSFVR